MRSGGLARPLSRGMAMAQCYFCGSEVDNLNEVNPTDWAGSKWTEVQLLCDVCFNSNAGTVHMQGGPNPLVHRALAQHTNLILRELRMLRRDLRMLRHDL
jgi:hypothetical protein